MSKPVNFKRVISMIAGEEWSAMDVDVDVKGAAFERLRGKAVSEGKKGARQSFTLRPLIQAIGQAAQSKRSSRSFFPASSA